MASIVPGYEYDIFISYRQKDNKFDGWVTRFIDDLQRELEATFKEDISIYFDENPHNGLLEIHDVDKSLETKLKSLIFIPIISQTYCDPNSFAWQHEFVTFNKMASEDQYGRDIKLASGNTYQTNVSKNDFVFLVRRLTKLDRNRGQRRVQTNIIKTRSSLKPTVTRVLCYLIYTFSTGYFHRCMVIVFDK